MMTLRKAAARGHFDHGWLDTAHTFSFADYFDPRHMGFRALRVINEDRVKPGHGFGTHPHRDMEILSYVLEGALEHRDSLGNGSVIRPGELQRMSAGTGVLHSEKNGSTVEPVHFLQIWLVPSKRGVAPGYEQKALDVASLQGRLRCIASPDGREGGVRVNTEAEVHAARLDEGDALEHPLAPGRHAWVHVARGAVRVNGQRMEAGDGAALSDEARVHLEGMDGGGELLLFDLA